MVADQVLPVIPVKKKSDVYYKYKQEEISSDYDSRRAPGAEANEIEWDVETESYLAETHALRYLLPDEVVENSDVAIKPKITTVQKLTRLLQLNWERRVKDLVTTAANLTNTFTPTTQWDAGTGATIEKDVDRAKQMIRLDTSIEPNAMLLNPAGCDAVKQWLKLTAYTEYEKFLSVGKLPDELWDMQLIKAKAVENSAVRGLTEVRADMWPKHALLFYKESAPSLEAFSFGWTLRSRNWRTKDWREESREGDMYEVSVIQDEVLAAEFAGCLILNITA